MCVCHIDLNRVAANGYICLPIQYTLTVPCGRLCLCYLVKHWTSVQTHHGQWMVKKSWYVFLSWLWTLWCEKFQLIISECYQSMEVKAWVLVGLKSSIGQFKRQLIDSEKLRKEIHSIQQSHSEEEPEKISVTSPPQIHPLGPIPRFSFQQRVRYVHD